MKTRKSFGFEGGWQVLPSPYRNVLPRGWRPYGDPDRMPEYGYPLDTDPHLSSLVKRGTRSIQYGLNWNTHAGGCYYVQDTKAGDTVRFWIHGRYIYDVPSDDVKPGDTVGPIHMRVGIGQIGKPEQATWSPEQEIAVRGYDVEPVWYRFEVEAKAKGDATALFLYTAPTYAGFRHSGPVWDGGGVEITRAEAPFDYPAFVWYVPQDVAPADYLHICNQAGVLLRSVTRSEHDAIAMVSLSPEPHIVAWECEDRKEKLERFWRIFEPDLDLTFRTLDEPEPPPPLPPPPPSGKMRAGLHLQTRVEGDLEYHQRCLE